MTILFRTKDTGPWETVPCIDNVGSCLYEDICELMSHIPTCPPQLVAIGLNCKCPVAAVSLRFDPNLYCP